MALFTPVVEVFETILTLVAFPALLTLCIIVIVVPAIEIDRNPPVSAETAVAICLLIVLSFLGLVVFILQA
jgi:hypothetical protein